MPARFYLLDQTPVQIIEDEDGVSLVAFNPFYGGYTHQTRFYRLIKANRDGDVMEVTIFDYQQKIIELATEYGFPENFIKTEKEKLADLLAVPAREK